MHFSILTLGSSAEGHFARAASPKATKCDGHHIGRRAMSLLYCPSGAGCRQVGVTMTTMEIFAWLLIGHAIADYPLQSEWVARAKQPGFTFGGEAIWPS